MREAYSARMLDLDGIRVDALEERGKVGLTAFLKRTDDQGPNFGSDGQTERLEPSRGEDAVMVARGS